MKVTFHVESRILFLGTGTGGAAHRQLRATGGIIIQSQGYQFMIDPGPGALLRAKQYGVNVRLNTALLISHAHINHCNDANIIIGAMTHNGLDPKGVVIANKTFVSGSEEIRPVLSRFHQKCVERIITPEEGQKIGIEDIEIHALKTIHSDPHALGFKFFTKDFVVSYLGDTGFSKDLVDQYLQSDILIINMPHEDKKDEGNLNKEDVIKLLKLVQPKLAIITHFGLKILKGDTLLLAREIKEATQVQTIAAIDGMLLNPQSYSAELKHKTLNLFPSEKAQEFKESTEEEHIQQYSQESETALPGSTGQPSP